MRVLITTSGIGSRLGERTKYTNKCLVRVGDKPAISHIVENYPKDTTFIITLGYYGNHVRDFLLLAYPNRKFIFFDVKKYTGTGSSLLHSIREARAELQCPFIFHACDAIILDKINNPQNENWVLGCDIKPADQYRTLNITGDGEKFLSKINEKGEIFFDLAYPGVLGINQYSLFWKCLDEVINNNDTQLSDCHVIEKMMTKGEQFRVYQTKKWYDIGEPFSLLRSRNYIRSSMDVLDKPKENVYLLDDCVIKFFHDPNMVTKRVARANILKRLVPKILDSKDNFFKYEYVEGDLFSSVVNPKLMNVLLRWSKKHMWARSREKKIEKKDVEKFYFDKTRKRIQLYLKDNKDKEHIINGELIPPVETMLASIDKEWLTNAKQAIIHGDFILDNIIKTDNGFSLIDWRQDFADSVEAGDVYYDLAKLNHNLTFNHELVSDKQYTIKQAKNGIKCDILCSKNLLDCKELLHKFIVDNQYDLAKVKILTSIIWINMAPLHEYPLNDFLFYFGKYNLHRTLGDL